MLLNKTEKDRKNHVNIAPACVWASKKNRKIRSSLSTGKVSARVEADWKKSSSNAVQSLKMFMAPKLSSEQSGTYQTDQKKQKKKKATPRTQKRLTSSRQICVVYAFLISPVRLKLGYRFEFRSIKAILSALWPCFKASTGARSVRARCVKCSKKRLRPQT